VLFDDQDVELGVVGLPDLIRRVGLAAVDELEALAVAHRPVMREHNQPMGRARARSRTPSRSSAPASRARARRDRLAVDERGRRRRATQREALDQLDEHRRCPPLAPVAAWRASQRL
jgi:hypothetical protein